MRSVIALLPIVHPFTRIFTSGVVCSGTKGCAYPSIPSF